MATKKSEGLKSDYIELENFQGLGKIRVDIMGKSLLFIGRNESGKSTLMRAMMSPMDTKQLPPEPIKQGEEHAKIIHKISGELNGEHKEYIMEMYFSQKDKKGRLVIKNEKGEVLKAPATLIKSIIGNVSFDVRQWLNDPKAKKLETIKHLSGVGPQVDAINVNIKNLKDQKKFKDNRVDELKGALNNHEFSQDEINRYSSPIDMTPLQQEMNIIGQNQNQWDDIRNKVEGFKQELSTANSVINSANQEIARLYEQIELMKGRVAEFTQKAAVANENIQKGEDWLNKVPRPSVDDINRRMGEAIAHNEKYNRIGMLGQQQREMIKLIEEVEGIKVAIDTEEQKRINIISNSQLPIAGLTFSDEDLFIDGLPLDERQINTARLWQIGFHVAKALNPNYKCIFFPDASLFDKKTLNTLIKEVDDAGYFGIFELVDFNGGPLHVEFAETILK